VFHQLQTQIQSFGPSIFVRWSKGHVESEPVALLAFDVRMTAFVVISRFFDLRILIR